MNVSSGAIIDLVRSQYGIQHFVSAHSSKPSPCKRSIKLSSVPEALLGLCSLAMRSRTSSVASPTSVTVSLETGVFFAVFLGLRLSGDRKLNSLGKVSLAIISSSNKRCRDFSGLTGRSVLLFGSKRWRSSSSPTDASELPDEDAGNVRFDLVDAVLLVEGDGREACRGPAMAVRDDVLLNKAEATSGSEAGREDGRVDWLFDFASYQGGSAWVKSLLDTAGEDGSRVDSLRFSVTRNDLDADIPAFLRDPAVWPSLIDLGVIEPISCFFCW